MSKVKVKEVTLEALQDELDQLMELIELVKGAKKVAPKVKSDKAKPKALHPSRKIKRVLRPIP